MSTRRDEYIGYSPVTAEEQFKLARRGGESQQRRGDFTAIEYAKDGVGVSALLSSAAAVTPSYFTVNSSGQMLVGNNVFELAKRSGLPWEWNYHAIQSLALFGHTVGRQTLHRSVFRVPEDTLLEATECAPKETRLGFWTSSALWQRSSSAPEVLTALRRAVAEQVADNTVLLSLSAGYDSRLLLALCLELGVKPRTVSMGPPDGVDVQMAAKLASMTGMPFERIELAASDYLRFGETIVKATSGTKTAANWHTHLYSRAAGSSEGEVHLVGSNGEYARTFYLYGNLKPHVFGFLPGRLGPTFLRRRLRERHRKLPLLFDMLGFDDNVTCALANSMEVPPASLSQFLDDFYLRQRVRHFIGNGIALYSLAGQPRAPFLESDVIDAIRRLPRSLRMQNRFHRWAVAEIAPELADLPYNPPGPGYSVFHEVRGLASCKSTVLDSPLVGTLFSEKDCVRVLEHGNTNEFELLLTLAFASRCATAA